MIISQTPIRISFVGGGTDLPSFYKQHPGRVLSTTINKYIYVIIKERYDDLIVLNYPEKEIVTDVNDIKHDLIRECIKYTGIYKGVDIIIVSDIPSKGSGLGSSSSLVVGLLNAMYTYQGIQKDLYTIAEEACKIEIDILSNPIGKQDQYAATFGGLKMYTFNPDDSIDIEKLDLNLNDILRLNSNLFLLYTGITRKSSDILDEQNKNTNSNLDNLKKMSDMPIRLKNLLENNKFEEFGQYLDKAWNFKKQLAGKIANEDINKLYNKGLESGATGGKLLGAGGGGFILFFVPLCNQKYFINKMQENHKFLPFRFERTGTRIIFNSPRNEHMI